MEALSTSYKIKTDKIGNIIFQPKQTDTKETSLKDPSLNLKKIQKFIQSSKVQNNVKASANSSKILQKK